MSDEERARLKRHIGQADDLATQARSLGLSDEADAIDSAVREYQDAWRRVEIAEEDGALLLPAASTLCQGALGRSLGLAGYNFLYVFEAVEAPWRAGQSMETFR